MLDELVALLHLLLGDEGGLRLVEHRSAFVKLPLHGPAGENLLVWTTTPWTLTSNVGAAVNPELTYLKVKLKGEVYYVAKGAFKLNRMEAARRRRRRAGAQRPAARSRDWLDGVPKLKSIEQMFKGRGKDGFEIVGEVKGAELVGCEYDGPFDELPAQQHRGRLPRGGGQGRRAGRAEVGPATTAADSRTGSSPADGRDRDRGHRHRPHRPGLRRRGLRLGKDNGLPPVAPLDESGVFVPASARSPAATPPIPRRPTRSSTS